VNIKEIAETVCNSINMQPLIGLYGSLDSNARQLLALIEEVGRDLRNTRAFPQLKKIYTFTTVNGQASYNLPNDFFCKSLDTEWDTSNKWKLLGPETDSMFNERVYGYVELENRTSYRMFGNNDTGYGGSGQFHITPTPGTSPVTLSFEYTSKNYILPRTWTTGFFADWDSYCFSAGRIYFTTAGGTTGTTPPVHSSGSVSDGGVIWTAQPLDFAYERATSDADRLVFEDEVILLGVKYKFLQSKGLDYSEPLDAYTRYKNTAIARWQGNKRIDLSGPYLIPSGLNPNVPDGNWSV